MKVLIDTLNIEALDSNISQTIMIHGGAGKASIGHLSFWIPVFELSEVDFVVLTREAQVYTALCEAFPTSTIVYARNPLDVEAVVTKLTCLKVVFYTSNVGKNIHLLRFNHIRHNYIGSKNSDYLSTVTKFYRAYDEIMVSGESQIDKFRAKNFSLRHLKFTKIGKPHLKDVLERKKNISAIDRALYLPSWEGTNDKNNLSSLNLLGQILYSFQTEFDISLDVKLHTKTARRDKSLAFISENILQDNSKITLIEKKEEQEIETTMDIASNVDMIICDIETLSMEFLALDIPLLVYIPIGKNLSTYLEDRYFAYDYTYTFSTVYELIEKIQLVLQGDDILQVKRKEAIEYWLGKEATVNNK
ncbi:MAG: hypothetical protein K0U38_01170, partial [Epsilonproteobacteria bacterium]|nr:hypothetical protein [Campylobacterota bacterium]